MSLSGWAWLNASRVDVGCVALFIKSAILVDSTWKCNLQRQCSDRAAIVFTFIPRQLPVYRGDRYPGQCFGFFTASIWYLCAWLGNVHEII